MSNPIYDIDEALYEQYLTDCRIDSLHPTMSDFLIWLDEHDYDRPEIYDGEPYNAD